MRKEGNGIQPSETLHLNVPHRSRIATPVSMMASSNTLAQAFKALHNVPGKPLVLANVYDIISARTVAELPSCQAIATASFAVARAAGTDDDDLTLADNIAAVRGVAKVAHELHKPLSVDIQEGYGDQLEEAINAVLDLGVVGVNIEDVDRTTQKVYAIDVAVERIKRVLEVARSRGVPDFVVNARCDVLVQGGEIAEVLERGKQYLAAGATTVFVWGGRARGTRTVEVEQMVRAFEGKLNVSMKLSPGAHGVEELARMGVSRISVGPALQSAAFDLYREVAEGILTVL